MTYKDLAVAIGRPNASRAVANACSKNPHPIVVPCHRVIRSDGRIGGYSGPGGSKQKRNFSRKRVLIRFFQKYLKKTAKDPKRCKCPNEHVCALLEW